MLRDRQTGKCNEAFVMELACVACAQRRSRVFARRHVCNNQCCYFSVAGETNKGLIEINRTSGRYRPAVAGNEQWAAAILRNDFT